MNVQATRRFTHLLKNPNLRYSLTTVGSRSISGAEPGFGAKPRTTTPNLTDNFKDNDRESRLQHALPSRPLNLSEEEDEAAVEALDNMVTFRDVTVSEMVISTKDERDVKTIIQSATVFEAISKMASHNIGALAIVDEQGELVGMFTERDYMHKVILKGHTSKSLPVHKIMTPKKDLITVTMNDSAAKCMHLMVNKSFRHLPILDSDKGSLSGLISIGDIVKFILLEQRQTIDYLRDYIERTY